MWRSVEGLDEDLKGYVISIYTPVLVSSLFSSWSVVNVKVRVEWEERFSTLDCWLALCTLLSFNHGVSFHSVLSSSAIQPLFGNVFHWDAALHRDVAQHGNHNKTKMYSSLLT